MSNDPSRLCNQGLQQVCQYIVEIELLSASSAIKLDIHLLCKNKANKTHIMTTICHNNKKILE